MPKILMIKMMTKKIVKKFLMILKMKKNLMKKMLKKKKPVTQLKDHLMMKMKKIHLNLKKALKPQLKLL
jgi:hypothetical protein